ncbi:MAG: hypothetical protein Q4G16_04200 [Cruoricaptor ignavus]|nr:hypothetical protein [Cruoricaptor ignavus]
MKKTSHIFIRAFRSLSFNKIAKLCSVWLPHPLFSVLAFYATVKTFRISERYFPKKHSSNSVENAFRHALWSCLVMMYCCKISSPKKALIFCKNITDLHEELFPNHPLETKMDLHNNKVGMDLFMEMLQGIHRQFFETSFFVEHLLKKVNTAKVLHSLHDDFPNDLVYLEEENRE